MGSRRWIGLGIAVVVVAVAAFVIAQSGGSGGGPLDAIAKAAEVTQREPGGRAVVNVTVTSAIEGKVITENGSMTYDENGRAEGELTVHGNGKEVKITSVVDGTNVYVTSDAFDEIPEGKKWMELDLAAATKGASPAGPASGGPEEGLKLLEHVKDSEVVGKEDIRGVPTTHYRGTPDTADEVFGVKVDVSAPSIDVWIDSQGRIRRTVIAATTAAGDSGQSVTTKMTMDFVEFGHVPKIEVPPADEAWNATSLIESQIQSEADGAPEVQTIH